MKLNAKPTSLNTAAAATTTTTGTSKTSRTPSTGNSNDDDWVDVTDKCDDVASKVFTLPLAKALAYYHLLTQIQSLLLLKKICLMASYIQ